jgi:hypothetical protein
MIRIAAVISLTLFLAGFAVVQARDRSYVTAGGGRTFVHEPDMAKRHVENGYNVFLGTGFDFEPWLSMHVVGEYHWGSVKREHGTWLQGTLKGKCAFVWLKLSPYAFGSRLAPYALGGFGYIYADRTESAGAVTYGIGADFWISGRMGLFIEVRRVRADFEPPQVEGRPLKVGMIYLLRM